MTGRNGSQKKGLFAGFLSGTAMCLCLGAAAAYVSPLDRAKTVDIEPSVETSEQAPVAPKNVTAEVAVITPKSDTQRDVGAVPVNEAPAEDRDDANVAASIREATDPVQTGTPKIEAPAPIDAVDAQTADTEETAPQTPVLVPLETTESAPEQSVAEIDVSSGESTGTAPEAETSDLAPSASQETTIKLALNAPKVEAPEAAPDVADVEAAAIPDVTPAPQPEAVEEDPILVAPKAPVVPKARPVIALNQPPATALEAPLQTVPLTKPDAPEPQAEAPATAETERSDDPALATPEADEATPTAPQAASQPDVTPSAPAQVETPVMDKEPEAPLIEQASIAPEVTEDEGLEPKVDAEPGADESQIASRRNPPPPSFEGRAFDAFAVKFIPPNNKPFLTVVLEHIGDGSVDMYDLLNFGQPITFGVNSTDTLAKWRENEFRKAGFEVVALVPGASEAGLSEGMADAAVAERISEYLEAVPGAVAVLDRTDSDLYRDPRKVARVADELGLSGRGLLVHEKFGINRALEAARSADIPAASLVRVIDKQRDAASIRRALDRAALDASKTGAAIVFGRTYPETVAALLPWLLGNSARSVTLAPVTSTMNRMVE